MKVEKTAPEGLNRRTLRAVERKLKIYLDKPLPEDAVRSPKQQFAVYDKDEKFAGHICAEDRFFSKEELEKEIRKLFST